MRQAFTDVAQRANQGPKAEGPSPNKRVDAVHRSADAAVAPQPIPVETTIGSWRLIGPAKPLALCLLLLALMGAVGRSMAAQDPVEVRRGDALWRIADRVYADSGLSRDQIMLALVRANPDAFAPSCNVNGLMRVGAACARLAARRGLVGLDCDGDPALGTSAGSRSGQACRRRGVQPRNGGWMAARKQPDPNMGVVSGKAPRDGIVSLFQRVVTQPGGARGLLWGS